jgi:hypothetical protein
MGLTVKYPPRTAGCVMGRFCASAGAVADPSIASVVMEIFNDGVRGASRCGSLLISSWTVEEHGSQSDNERRTEWRCRSFAAAGHKC